MRCPRCRALRTRVIDTRLVRGGRRRIRRCRKCSREFYTIETAA